MTEQVGMMEQGTAVAVTMAAAEAARPRIGADRFRALADRLKKPGAIAAPVATAAQPVAAAAVAIPSLDIVSAEAPAPAMPPVLQQVVVQEAASQAAAPVLTPEPALTPAPTPVAVTWPEPAVVPQAAVEPLPIPPAVPAVAPIVRAPSPPSFTGPAASPLERILSARRPAPAPAVVLPEILPPPPPPTPLVIEDNGAKIELSAPSLEEVQERLREDATVRLLQLDIDNVWRQVLASPTLDERAEYLREAAEIMMAEQGVAPVLAELPPEHDLSRIEEAVATGGAVPVPAAETVRRTEDTTPDQMETAELARSLLDMMSASGGSGLPHERALAADTLLRLLPKLSLKSLQMLAQRLAMMDNPPQLLVAKLIRDDRVEVSGPLLEDCMQITDQDLAMVVAEDNANKRRMIARRRKLSRAITDKLIATNEPSVLLTLVRNAAAEISHDGFVALTEAAYGMPDLMAPLSTRTDLAAPTAFELFWPAPVQLRRYLLHRFLTDSETLTKILKITLSTGASDDLNNIELPSPGEVMELLVMACKGRTETAAQRLGRAIGVDHATVQKILMDRGGEAMVVMLKAAGYPRSGVADLLPALKRGEIPLIDDDRDVDELQSMFDTLSMNKARILITYWDWAVRKAGPYAPVH